MRHETSGLEAKLLDKMAEICHKPTMAKGWGRDLANRWFQPLTHVSGGGFPRYPAPLGQRGKREKRNSRRFAVAQRVAHSVPAVFADLRPLRCQRKCSGKSALIQAFAISSLGRGPRFQDIDSGFHRRCTGEGVRGGRWHERER
jgi:hypothetical protein